MSDIITDHTEGFKQSTTSDYRYPGPHSFQDTEADRHRFFGRKQEQKEIVNKVLSVDLMILFGKSGLGKTSLLNASVFPELRKRNFLPFVVRVNRKGVDPATMVIDTITDICRDMGIEHGDRSGLWEYFKSTVFWHANTLWTPVLVLDQFEEIFTLQEEEARLAIARQIGELVGSGQPERIRKKRPELQKGSDREPFLFSDKPPVVKLIISMREEYVGTLQEIFPEVPTILSNRVRLTPLSREKAEEAVVGPARYDDGEFKTKPYSYEKTTLDELLSFLSDRSGQVEPFQLQVLCSHVEKQVEGNQKCGEQKKGDDQRVVVDDTYLNGREGMEKIIGNFYQNSIKTLKVKKARRRARRLCEFGLLTQDGYRDHMSQRKVLETYKLTEGELDQLVEARLLRREPQFDSFTYELTHDSLTEPVKRSRPIRIPKKLLSIVGGLAFVLICIFSFLGYQSNMLKQHADEVQRVKETTQAVAQKEVVSLIEKNKSLTNELGDLQKNTQDIIRKMENQRVEGDEALAGAREVIEKLENELVQQQEQALLAIDKNTQQQQAELEVQRENTERLLAEMKEKLAMQQEASDSLEKKLTQQTAVVVKSRKSGELGKSSIHVPEMVTIEPGQFMMGSEKGDSKERPRHKATITKQFQIGKYEVAFEEYDTFALATGRELPDDEGWGRVKRPVINVSWHDTKAYAKWLSEQTGKSFRLPSESEWEYAVRAGTVTKWYCGDDEDCLNEIAWYYDNSGNKTHPVGEKQPNAWGLHDMTGNVWEWVEDDGHENYHGVPDDGSAWVRKKERGSYRVVRGGSWRSNAQDCRSAYRGNDWPRLRNIRIGFRLARSVIPMPEMVDIRPGQFLMGSEKGDSEEKPVHKVMIEKPFQIGKYEITFEEYDTFAQATGKELPDDEGWGRGKRPVINVSWYDANTYAKWLSEQTGKSYRLPSEAEWEYATRAGTITKWYCGDKKSCLKDIAWFYSNSDKKTHPVGKKRPNAWGLYDVSGNVLEWVEDNWYDNYQGAPDDGSARKNNENSNRVIRGGRWNSIAQDCRSAYRSSRIPDYRDFRVGFRLVRSVDIDP